MTKSKALLGLLAIAVAGAAAASGLVGTDAVAKWFPPLKWLTRDTTAAQSQGGRPTQRAVAVEVGRAVKKKTPVILGALGNVSTIASVAARTRIDNEIVAIHFSDGAVVTQGDLLVSLASRMIEAQIAQAEKHKHMTATQAAFFAREAGVGELVLIHFASRYKGRYEMLVEEAKAIFGNTSAEIPPSADKKAAVDANHS